MGLMDGLGAALGGTKSEIVAGVMALIDGNNSMRKSRLEMPQIRTMAQVRFMNNLSKGMAPLDNLENVSLFITDVMMSYKGQSRVEAVEFLKNNAEVIKDIPRAKAIGENKKVNG